MANFSNSQYGGRTDGPRDTESRGNRVKDISNRAFRCQQRAYDHGVDQAFANNWAAAPFNPQPQEGKRTNQSKSWMDKKTAKKNQKAAEPKPENVLNVNSLKARKESPPVDEPLWDLGPHTAGIPTREIYAQNFEFSGFIDINERVYNQLRGIDPRIDRRLPYSMFLHSNTTILNAVMIDVAKKNGENKIPESGMAQDLLPEEFNLAGPIHEYFSQISNTTTCDGDEVRVNRPDICIPGVGDQLGHFGPVTATNDNAYECYVAPIVTARRVLATRAREVDWDIPDITGDLIPNENLLGFGPIDVLQGEAQAMIKGFNFPTSDNLAGRIQYCPELMMRVNTVVREYRDRFKFVNIGLNEQGVRNYIKGRPTPSNLTFVTSDVDNEVRLSLNQIKISCPSAFSNSTSGQTILFTQYTLSLPSAPVQIRCRKNVCRNNKVFTM